MTAFWKLTVWINCKFRFSTNLYRNFQEANEFQYLSNDLPGYEISFVSCNESCHFLYACMLYVYNLCTCTCTCSFMTLFMYNCVCIPGPYTVFI